MANLIITENSLMAIYVAASLGGIKRGKSKITIQDIPSSTSQLNEMVLGGTKSFETTVERTQTHVTWVGDSPMYEAETKTIPEVYRYKSFRLNKDVLERLTRKKYKTQKTEKVDAVYFALLDTEQNAILKELIRKTISAKSYYNLNIREMSEKGIRKAFSSAENYNGAKASETKLRDVHRTNIRREIEKRLEEEGGLDHYALCAMMLITRRETIRKAQKDRHIIQAKSHIHGIPCAFVGKQIHTKEEAEKLIEGFPQTVVFDGRYDDGLLKTVDLFSSDKLWEDEDPYSLLRDMFIKGYISNPLTNSRFLPLSFHAEDDDNFLAACRNWTKEETFDRRDAKRALEKLKAKDQSLGAVTPCGTEGKDHMPLSDTESGIYDTIVSLSVSAVESNMLDKFRFYAGDYPLYSQVYVDEIKNNLRTEEHLGAIFEAIEEGGGKKFDYITLHEIFEDLDGRGIGNADIYLQTMTTLIRGDYISINKGGGATLTEKGERVFSEIPVGKGFLSLCSQWEEEIADMPNMQWPDKALDECRKRLDEDRRLWDKAKGIKRQSKDKGAAEGQGREAVSKTPSEERKTPDPIPEHITVSCPVCGKRTVSETDDAFTCSSCGFSIGKSFSTDGYTCTVTEKDVERLAKHKKTSGKSFRSESETLSAYIVLEDGMLDITNQSDIPCPYCGDLLYTYEWGFGCDRCNYNVPFEIGGVRIPMKEYMKLLKGQPTGPIPGFVDDAGGSYEATLSAEQKENGYIVTIRRKAGG